MRRLCVGSLLWVPLAGLAAGQEAAVQIAAIDVGSPRIGSNNFRATLVNRTDQPVLAVLDLRAEPGMWLLPNRQDQFGFRLAAGEHRSVEATYRFDRMSPEAQLRVRLGPGRQRPDGTFAQEAVLFDRHYPVGRRNPAALDIEQYFEVLRRGRFELFVWRGSAAEGDVEAIASERARAVDAIARMLEIPPPERIRLVFYPLGEAKAQQTGHTGSGLALGTTIVEVYDAAEPMDPFHELTHVLANRLGDLPALFDEGLAVHASERLGADALRALGSPGLSADRALCRFREGQLFALGELAALTEIGSPDSRPEVAYPQAASFVGFLIEEFGLSRFRELYRALAGHTEAPAERVEAALFDVLGVPMAELERRWLDHVEAGCG